MAKPNCIELPTGDRIPILYEDRSVLAIDKPRGWMLVPFSWQKTTRNLQAALVSAIAAGDFWARSRHLKFLRFVHRLDADTSGVLLLAKSQGALNAYGDLFERRRMEKVYLAVVHGLPAQKEWTCRLKLGPDPRQRGRMKLDSRHGKPAETFFRVLESRKLPRGGGHSAWPRQQGTLASSAANTVSKYSTHMDNSDGHSGRQDADPLRQAECPPLPSGTLSLIEARPFTGRTHQIRVHLAESGCPVVGDDLYATPGEDSKQPLGLRAVSLAYHDPFTRRRIHIEAPIDEFCRQFGFTIYDLRFTHACHG
jgi:23S rRNA-/tRNA-specific pseudouridylate synthase